MVDRGMFATKRRVRLFTFMALSLLWAVNMVAAAPPEKRSLDELKQRLVEIDAELDQLAQFTLRGGAGNIGWFSKPGKNLSRSEWAEIQLPEDSQFDRVVLVPLLWNDAESGPQATSFPEAFKIVAGVEGDSKGQVIASVGPDEDMLPRLAPLVIDLPPTRASWVRVESTQLSPWARDERFVLGFSEIMVFSGERNIALMQPVRVSSVVGGWGEVALSPHALTDGFTPFLMDAQGDYSTPYFCFFPDKVPYSFVVDLGSSHLVDGLRIHSTDQTEHIPQIFPVDFGIPYHLLVEGSNHADFLERTILLEYKRNSAYDAGPILTRNVTATSSRYIRFSALTPYQMPPESSDKNSMGLAEFEVLADGQNVAKNKQVIFPNRRRDKGARHFNKGSITDGKNHFGEILTSRDWMEQLARRHDLEVSRPGIIREINHHQARQQTTLRWMIWISVLLFVGIGIAILLGRILRQRAILKTRERIAANLHDELGANLNAISLLGEYAQALIADKKKDNSLSHLSETVGKVSNLSTEAEQAARRCTNLLKATGGYENLVEELERSADRLLADIEYETHIENEKMLISLAPRKRLDLVLFHKECLNNAVRHAKADKVITHLSGTPRGISLSVTDDGVGLSQSSPPEVPASLRSRAKLLGGKVTASSPEGGGSCITVFISFRRSLFGLTFPLSS